MQCTRCGACLRQRNACLPSSTSRWERMLKCSKQDEVKTALNKQISRTTASTRTVGVNLGETHRADACKFFSFLTPEDRKFLSQHSRSNRTENNSSQIFTISVEVFLLTFPWRWEMQAMHRRRKSEMDFSLLSDYHNATFLEIIHQIRSAVSACSRSQENEKKRTSAWERTITRKEFSQVGVQRI